MMDKELASKLNDAVADYRIAELLAQPETEQEPAAWMWEEREYKGYTGQYRTYGISREKPALDGIIENIQPLYLAPPKRDPLSCHGIGE